MFCRHVYVSGRVQGVGFRWYASREARELGLKGWIANLHDGRVEAWLEGSEDAVTKMLGWLGHGPPAARVTALEVLEAEPHHLVGFDVRRAS